MNLKAKKKSLKAQIRQRSTILHPHKRNQAKWKCIQTIPLKSFSKKTVWRHTKLKDSGFYTNQTYDFCKTCIDTCFKTKSNVSCGYDTDGGIQSGQTFYQRYNYNEESCGPRRYFILYVFPSRSSSSHQMSKIFENEMWQTREKDEFQLGRMTAFQFQQEHIV